MGFIILMENFRSPWENLCLILFICGALYAIFTVKERASYVSSSLAYAKSEDKWQNKNMSDRNFVMSTPKQSHHNQTYFQHSRYCRICQHNVPGKDHHCVWIDACISRVNIYPFIAFLVCIFLTLVHAGLLFLTSVCDQTILSSLLYVPWSAEVRIARYVMILKNNKK